MWCNFYAVVCSYRELECVESTGIIMQFIKLLLNIHGRHGAEVSLSDCKSRRSNDEAEYVLCGVV